MAKTIKIDEKSLIHINLEKLEDKVNEFQEYLQMNRISASVTENSEILLSLDAQDKLHKEILIQIKMQDALFGWLPLLEKLKQGEEDKKGTETYGDVEVSNMFKRNKGV